MNSIITCNNLCYSYNKGKHKKIVLENIQLDVKKGNTIAILGQSGCGKSTLLNLISGIDKPDSGNILLNGVNITALNENKTTLLRAKYLSFVYQFHHLLKEFSALYNVAMPLLIRGDAKHKAVKAAKEMLINIGLKEQLNNLPSQLSGGERQRVAIARAIITKPKCLLADEPTGNLDSENAKNTLELLISLNQQQKSSLIIATHDKRIIEVVNTVLVLKNKSLSQYKNTAI